MFDRAAVNADAQKASGERLDDPAARRHQPGLEDDSVVDRRVDASTDEVSQIKEAVRRARMSVRDAGLDLSTDTTSKICQALCGALMRVRAEQAA